MLDQFLVFRMCKNNDSLVFDQSYQVRDYNIRLTFNELKLNFNVYYNYFEIQMKICLFINVNDYPISLLKAMIVLP